MGRRVPYAEKKFFSRDWYGFCKSLYPPSTFGLLGPSAEKMTQIGRCFRISFHRPLDEVRFSTFLVPLMERLIPDCDQLNPFCAKFLEPENCKVDLWKINGVPMESIKSKENQLSGKLSAEESGDLSRFFEIFPRISENFREFSRIFENFQNFPEFSSIPGIFQENVMICDFWGDFPQGNRFKTTPKTWFSAPAAPQKNGKMHFYRHEKWPKNHLFNYGIRHPQKFSASVCATQIL